MADSSTLLTAMLADAVTRYPELQHYADDRPEKAVRLAAALDGYSDTERQMRREVLGKRIAAEREGRMPARAPDLTRAGLQRARRKLAEQEARADASRPSSPPPCPPWCALPAGHAYDSYDPRYRDHEVVSVVHFRQHVSTADPAAAYVEQTESSHDGKVTLEPPVVIYDGEMSEHGADAAEARRVAAALLAAADLLDTLTATAGAARVYTVRRGRVLAVECSACGPLWQAGRRAGQAEEARQVRAEHEAQHAPGGGAS